MCCDNNNSPISFFEEPCEDHEGEEDISIEPEPFEHSYNLNLHLPPLITLPIIQLDQQSYQRFLGFFTNIIIMVDGEIVPDESFEDVSFDSFSEEDDDASFDSILSHIERLRNQDFPDN